MMDKVLKLLSDRSFRKYLFSKQSREDIGVSVDVRHGIKVSYRMGDGLTEDEAAKVLKLLISEGLVKEALHSNTVLCPYCSSVDVQTSYVCPRCGSLDIGKDYVIQHIKCGSMFSADRLTISDCPKCGQPISSVDELRVAGGLFRCNTCNSSFDIPVIRYTCNECGRNFTIREAQVKKIHTYAIKEDAERILDILFAYKIIADILSSKGYEVMMPGEIVGSSGVTHRFALIVKGKDNTSYVVDLTGYLGELDIDSIVRDYIKIMDIPSSKYIYVVSNSEDHIEAFVRNLPTKNVIILHVKSVDDIIAGIEKVIVGEAPS